MSSTVPNLPAAILPLSGTEEAYVVQNGNDRRAPVSAFGKPSLSATAQFAELIPTLTTNAGYSPVYALELQNLIPSNVVLVMAQYEVTSTLAYNVAIVRYLSWAATQASLISNGAIIAPCWPAGADDITPTILMDGQDHQTSNLVGVVTGLTGTVWLGCNVASSSSSGNGLITVMQGYGGISALVF